jgi:FixJ family two-component response regulator
MADDLGPFAVGLMADILTIEAPEQLHCLVTDGHWGCAVLGFPGMREDGFAFLPALREMQPWFSWLLWTRECDWSLAVAAMKAGATDVLLNPDDNAALAPRLSEMLASDQEQVAKWQQHREVASRFDQLSSAERAVLSLVLAARTNKQIAALLDCSLRTIESRRQRILETMQVGNAVELATLLARHALLDDVLDNPPETLNQSVELLHSASA